MTSTTTAAADAAPQLDDLARVTLTPRGWAYLEALDTARGRPSPPDPRERITLTPAGWAAAGGRP